MSPQHNNGYTKCKGCDRNIRFVKTDNGKNIPLDAIAPVYRVQRDLVGDIVALRERNCYVTHFATCPQADRFSSRKEPVGPACEAIKKQVIETKDWLKQFCNTGDDIAFAAVRVGGAIHHYVLKNTRTDKEHHFV